MKLSALVLAAVLSAGAIACSNAPGVAVPPGLAPFVDAARRSLERESDGLPFRSFRFLAARCSDDGGLVLLFEQTSPFGSDGMAFALSGSPRADAGGWAGGFAPIDPVTDPEIRFFFAERREVPCEAR